MRLNLELHKQRKSRKKTQFQFIISFIFSASQMLILNPSRYKREGAKLLQTIEKQILSLLDKRDNAEERCLLHATESICNIFLLLKRRWLRKTKFFEDGGVLFSSHVFYSTIDFRTPSELFSQKKFSSLFKRDSIFSMFERKQQ